MKHGKDERGRRKEEIQGEGKGGKEKGEKEFRNSSYMYKYLTSIRVSSLVSCYGCNVNGF